MFPPLKINLFSPLAITPTPAMVGKPVVLGAAPNSAKLFLRPPGLATVPTFFGVGALWKESRATASHFGLRDPDLAVSAAPVALTLEPGGISWPNTLRAQDLLPVFAWGSDPQFRDAAKAYILAFLEAWQRKASARSMDFSWKDAQVFLSAHAERREAMLDLWIESVTDFYAGLWDPRSLDRQLLEISVQAMTYSKNPSARLFRCLDVLKARHPDQFPFILLSIAESTLKLFQGEESAGLRRDVARAVLWNFPLYLSLEGSATFEHLVELPWEDAFVSRCSRALLELIQEKITLGQLELTPQQTLAIIEQAFLQAEATPEGMTLAFEFLGLLGKEGIADFRAWMRDHWSPALRRQALSVEQFQDLVAFLEERDLLDPKPDLNPEDTQPLPNLYQFFGAKEFLLEHPWKEYGYSASVVRKIHAFAKQDSLTGREGFLLVSFLFSVRGEPRAEFYAQLLLEKTSESGLHNLIPFLAFWRSLPEDLQGGYLERRCGDLDAEQKEALFSVLEMDGSHDEVKRKVAQHQSRGITIRKTLAKRLQMYEDLAASREAQDLEQRDRLYWAWLQKYGKFHLDPAQELPRITDFLYQSFFARLGFDEKQEADLRERVQRDADLWYDSKVLPRLIQFSGFATEEGLGRIRELIDKIVDPEETSVRTIALPFRAEPLRYWDYQGKFAFLVAQFAEVGIDPEKAEFFLARWRQPYYVQQVAEDEFYVVTHDIARWIRHGEEPDPLSCQRIDRKMGEMRLTNWNRRFGTPDNSDGKALCRPLLPQLKLGLYFRRDKPVARRVIEVGYKFFRGAPQLKLLREKIFEGPKGFSDAMETRMEQADYEYAAYLGLSFEQVQTSVPVDDYGVIPANVVDTFWEGPGNRQRIYRDFFRPRREVAAGT